MDEYRLPDSELKLVHEVDDKCKEDVKLEIGWLTLVHSVVQWVTRKETLVESREGILYVP